MTEKVKYASFWERVLALLIDSSIYMMIIMLALFKISGVNDFNVLLNNIYDFVLLNLGLCALIMILEVLMISKLGATVGMLIIGLRIQKDDGAYLNWKQAFVRITLGRSVSGLFFGMGYFWIFRNAKRRAWHDIINQTVVVKKNNYGWAIGLVILSLFLFINFETAIGIVSAVKDNLNFYSSLLTG